MTADPAADAADIADSSQEVTVPDDGPAQGSARCIGERAGTSPEPQGLPAVAHDVQRALLARAERQLTQAGTSPSCPTRSLPATTWPGNRSLSWSAWAQVSFRFSTPARPATTLRPTKPLPIPGGLVA